jgi:hypothetical protein
MNSKTITIDSQHLKLNGKKRSKTMKPNQPLQMHLNSKYIREMLLEKLKKNRKTMKNPPKINTNPFDQTSVPPVYLEPKLSETNEINSNELSIPVNLQQFPEKDNDINCMTSNSNISEKPFTVVNPDKPYGILKNGIKPTYKTWSLSQKNYNEPPNSSNIQVVKPITNPIIVSSNISSNNLNENKDSFVNKEINSITTEPEQVIQEKEIKKTYFIGKNKKTNSIGVLIKNLNTRKKIEEDITKYRKTNITTIKNYLKSHNIIKHGTNAPVNLLRSMYENIKLCGDVNNDNINNMLHNFEKD